MIYSYTCVRCRAVFEKQSKIDTARFEPRCPTCHAEDRKASKRATWRKHGAEFRARQVAKDEALKEVDRVEAQVAEFERDEKETAPAPTRQAPLETPKVPPSEPVVQAKRGGRPVSLSQASGRKIVWMADDLPSSPS